MPVQYKSGTRCFVAGCARFCKKGKLCPEHYRRLPPHLRYEAWKGIVTNAIQYFDGGRA